jgi:hypothetical protein
MPIGSHFDTVDPGPQHWLLGFLALQFLLCTAPLDILYKHLSARPDRCHLHRVSPMKEKTNEGMRGEKERQRGRDETVSSSDPLSFSMSIL